MTIVLGQQSNELLEWVRLGATVLAAVAVIAAAVVTATLTSRRESDSWLKEKRAAAYKDFVDALDDSIDIITGQVDKALSTPGYPGLEESREAAQDSQNAITRTMIAGMLFSGEAWPPIAGEIVGNWGNLLSRSVPLPGTAHGPALRQHLVCVDFASNARLNALAAMKHDLRRRTLLRKKAPKPAFPLLGEELEELAGKQEVDPRATLIEWRVRRWTASGPEEPNSGVGYVTDTYPWAFIHADNTNLEQPLAAALWKQPDVAWFFAISDQVTDPAAIMQLELAAARAVVTHGSNLNDPFDHGVWVEVGVSGQERLHYWPMVLLDPDSSTDQ